MYFKENGINEEWVLTLVEFIAEENYSEEFLQYINTNSALIFSEMEKARQILDLLQEPNELFHQFINNDDTYYTPAFEKALNENISMSMERYEGADSILEVECVVNFNNEKMTFTISEGDYDINIA